MAVPVKLTPPNKYGASRLNKVARKIVSLAFAMGGSLIEYYRASRCNYQFPDGTYCWNEDRQTATPECPVCGGRGMYYQPPIKIPAIFIDASGKPIRDKYGIVYRDSARLVVPPEIVPSILKHVDGGKNMQMLRDKFLIRDHNEKPVAVFYIESEPKDVWLAGTLYFSFEIIVNRVSESDADPIHKDYKPRLEYIEGGDMDTQRLLKEINEGILNMNDTIIEDGQTAKEAIFDSEEAWFIEEGELLDE